MKTVFLVIIALLSVGLSAQAGNLTCYRYGRAPITTLVVSDVGPTQVQVNLTDHLTNTEISGLVGHLVFQDSTPNTSIYELIGHQGTKGKLEVKKVVSDFLYHRNFCPRCPVAPAFQYSASLNINGTHYDFGSDAGRWPASHCTKED